MKDLLIFGFGKFLREELIFGWIFKEFFRNGLDPLCIIELGIGVKDPGKWNGWRGGYRWRWWVADVGGDQGYGSVVGIYHICFEMGRIGTKERAGLEFWSYCALYQYANIRPHKTFEANFEIFCDTHAVFMFLSCLYEIYVTFLLFGCSEKFAIVLSQQKYFLVTKKRHQPTKLSIISRITPYISMDNAHSEILH